MVVALLYQKINEAIENGIQVITDFSCSMVRRNVSDVIWVQILGTLLDNAIESLGAVSYTHLPFSPFSKQNRKNLPMPFLSEPQIKIFLAKR